VFWRVTTAALLVVVALLAWPLVLRYREPAPPPPPVIRVPLVAPTASELGVGDETLDAAISPGGDALAFVATSNGIARLWQRRMDADQASVLAGTEGARHPAWSPDGQQVAFLAGQRLKQLTVGTRAIQDLAEAADTSGVAWLDDRSLIFGTTSTPTLTRLRDGGQTAATTLSPGDKAHLWPSPCPGGFVYIALRTDGRRVIRRSVNGSTTELGTTDGDVRVVGSILLHVRGGALLAQRLDENGSAIGRPAALATAAGIVDGRSLVAASPRVLLVAPPSIRARELVWIDAAGMRGTAASDHGDYWQVRLAPDDRAAAVTQLEPQLRTLDVYTVPLQPGGAPFGVSLALAADTDPVWSPDGASILFRSLQGGTPRLYSRVTGRQGVPIEPVPVTEPAPVPSDWRADAGVLMQAASPRGDTDLFVIDRVKGTSRAVVSSRFNESDGRWSPDGRVLAYVSDEFGQPDVFAQPWPDGGRVRVSGAGGHHPRWSRDGRTLFFLRGSELVRVALTATPLSVSSPVRVATVPGIRDFDVAHRDNRLLAILPTQTSPATEIRALIDWQGAVPPAVAPGP
jgi:Tol biopolymer transport system component